MEGETGAQTEKYIDTDRQRDSHTDRQTDGHTNKGTGKHAERQANGQTIDRQILSRFRERL